MNVEFILSIIEISVLVLSVLIAFFVYLKSKKDSKIKYTNELFMKIVTDRKLLETFHYFDYGVDIDYKNHETEIDQFLLFFENILFLSKKNSIDLVSFSYFLERIKESITINAYFSDLDNKCKEEKIVFPFPLLKEFINKKEY